MTPDRHSVFDEVADLYDRVRPSYPDGLIDDMIAISGLPDRGRILEIGCGTGQMTLPLARRGYRIDAVELGPALAAVATRNLAPYPDAGVHNAAFEEWPLPDDPFDLVVSATTFHWIDPTIRLEKAAAALAPTGAIAIIETQHVSGRDDAFFDDVQRCYVRHMPGTPEGLRLAPASEIALGLDGPGEERFSTPAVRRYDRETAYTTGEYIDVLRTYSGHIELSQENAAALYACVRDLIDRGYGGRIRKQYLFGLMVARLRFA